MKESFLKDMYAAKNGVMNPWDGTQKDTYWDTTILFESYMFHTYTFPYQRELDQLAEQKACCDMLIKVPLRNEILKNFECHGTIVSKNSTNRKTNSVFFYMDILGTELGGDSCRSCRFIYYPF